MRAFRAGVLAPAALLASLSCGGQGTEPSRGGPVTVDLTVVTPNNDDGALLLAVTGGGVSGIAGAGFELAATTPGDSGVTLLVRGNLASGVVARLTIPDRSRLGRYRAIVLQAAARGPGYDQRALSGYQASLTVP